MLTDLDTTASAAVDLARESLYRFLAAALGDPHGNNGQLIFDEEGQRLVFDAADLLREEAAATTIPLGFGELPTEALDARPFLEPLRQPPEHLYEEYHRVFGLTPPRECPPFETDYHKMGEPFFCSQQMADIAGFYRAFGLEPSALTSGRPDYLGLELEFMAFVLMKKRLALAAAAENPGMVEHAAVCDEAQAKFFGDHLAWWVPSFATGLRRRAERGFYFHLGQLLAALMPLERHRFGVAPPRLPIEAAPPVAPEGEEEAGCAGCDMQT